MPFDGTNLDENRKVLIEARRLIKRGWCQRDYKNRDRVCLHRALTEAALLAPNYSEALQAAFSRVLAVIPPNPVSRYIIQDWNDEPGRTQEEVLAVLDRALS
jgi:hypothetical protein